jgi:hypothetical protein
MCLGQPIHLASIHQSIHINRFKSFHEIHEYMSVHNKILLFLGEAKHKIKKKAEQIACEEALQYINDF